MPALRVTCQNCQRVTVVDSDKVPDQPVSYRCPNCQSKVLIDKRKLLAGESDDGSTVSLPRAAQPSAAAAGGERSSGSLVVAPDSLLEMALPPGESIPPGLLVAEDRELAEQVKRMLEPYDCVLETFADAAAARESALQDPPPLLLYVADAVTKPPYAPLEPLVTLPPRERRNSFLVLVASNVKTLDGNLAFLYQVNLLLNRQHVSQAAGILYSALRSHQRLYKPFLAALAE
jgi:DNA-directed RNA polymerase subunit RPC12/RpoP